MHTMVNQPKNKLIKEFLHNYFSQNNFIIKKIESGIENYNYLVILNRNKYVLRIYRRKKLSQIKNEVRLIEYLIANNTPTPNRAFLIFDFAPSTFPGFPSEVIHSTPAKTTIATAIRAPTPTKI